MGKTRKLRVKKAPLQEIPRKKRRKKGAEPIASFMLLRGAYSRCALMRRARAAIELRGHQRPRLVALRMCGFYK